MQIVIELSDETYKAIKEENGIYGINNGLSARITGKVVGAIQNGTQLSKEQGMAIDEAIERIKDHKIVHKMNEPRAICISKALDMANNALEQITGEDCTSRQSEYEPVTAEDFAKTMSERTIDSFWAWHGEALVLMRKYGFVICKKKQ